MDIRNRTLNFSRRIILFYLKFPSKRVFWVIGDQIIRSLCSIGANIVEAKASISRKEFIKYYHVALKSANETRYWLELINSFKKFEKVEIKFLMKELDEITRIIASCIIKLKNKG